MKKFLFIIIVFFALIIGMYPLIYFFVEHKHTFLGSKSPEILQSHLWKFAFFAHIIFGGISLFIGWRQFGSQFRNKHLKIHRIIGKSYVVSVLISSVSSIYMGIHANGGIVACVGFVCLGLIWLSTTLMSVVYISKGDVTKHQQLMIYSYACTFAAVTLRIWLPVLENITYDPDNSYRAVAWLSWMPNLWVAYIINKKNLVRN